MNEMETPKSVNCIDKALEIPVVLSMRNNVGHFYTSVKEKNRISKFGLNTIESGVTLFYRSLNSLGAPIQKPIDLVDSVACVVLDEVKEKYPGILEPTDTVIESSKSAILRTNVAQKTLNGVDAVLGVAETFITMFPSVRVKDDGDAGNGSDRTLLIKALKPITVCYSLATWPLRYTAGVLHERRTRIRTLSRNFYSDDESDREETLRRAVSSNKQFENVSITECIFFIPRFLLRTVGRLASERSERLFLAQSLIADRTPNKADVSTEEKKRKYDCIDSDEFDDAASLNDLNETLGDATDPDDDDFVPSDVTVDSDSMEYNSGSVVEENDELNESSNHQTDSDSLTLTNLNEQETVNQEPDDDDDDAAI